ncbi:MAG: hypothetical protein M1814_003729 [Vezdaea aestivalis]|nr:MAG: hypothetical protein M1814_003729 [Vezdaea aestivalis]
MDGIDSSRRSTSAFDSPTFSLDMAMNIDRPVGSMSISPCGRDVALGSRQGLHIIDLDHPYSPPRHLPHHTPWEVADVQWSPFAARDYWVISTSNQKALVWNIATPPGRSAVEFVLHGHTRAITDINFSAHDPDILATCAVDSFVHCWDLRTPKRPVATFCDWFAGATQVKWNRQDSHIIASSHDKCLRIWDNRKGAIPVRSIEAHGTKIYGVDWNRTKPTAVVTCSLDKTIKFWDYQNLDDKPERVIETPFPVWRARHTPFGSGICAMPQRGNNDLHLYDSRPQDLSERGGAPEHVHKFEGHRDQVKEFLWRPRGNIVDGADNREFQLVSWGLDRDLRLHRISDKSLAKVGFVKGEPVLAKYVYTRKDADYKSFRDDPSESPQGQNSTHRDSSGSNGEKQGGTIRGMLSLNINRSSGPFTGAHNEKGTMTSRVGMNARSRARRDINLIEWMKGVRIGKTKTNGPLGRNGSAHDPQAYLPQNFISENAWDTPESLFDEITYVGDTYKNVTFEKLDSQNRLATLSMNGPWGKGEKPVHVKLSIQFPEEYPESAHPTFSVQKTSSMSDKAYEMLSGGVQLIAREYVSRKRGCLEPAVCFLLGERGLEDSTLLSDDEGPSDSSSEEGDRVAPEMSSLPPDELDLTGNDPLSVANAYANVPRPKTCGAIFAEDGRLVCFFQPKEEESKAIIDSVTLQDSERSAARSLRLFEGFGRINPTSPESRPKTSSIGGEFTEERDDSDDDWTDSSRSSSTNDVSNLAKGLPRLPWGQSVFDQKKKHGPLSTDQSQISGNTGSGGKGSQSKSKSIVSIRPIDPELQPCRKDLAEKYMVLGSGVEICDHNAKVAASVGEQGLEITWKLLKLVLNDEVPLQVAQIRAATPILVIAKTALRTLPRRDSGIDITFDKEAAQQPPPQFKGTVNWGLHPFGSTWLIPRIFDHYERTGDIQMLAMLVCALTPSPPLKSSDPSAIPVRNLSKPHSPHPQPQTTYYPTSDIALALRHSPLVIPPTPKVHHAPSHSQPPSSHATPPLRSHPNSHPYSAGTTPPFPSRLSPAYLSSHPNSLSTSPEQTHSGRSHPHHSVAPPSPTAVRKRPSPVEAVLTNLATSGVTWGANTIFGSAPSHPAQRANSKRFRPGIQQSLTPEMGEPFSASEADEEAGRGQIQLQPKLQRFRLKRKNLQLFDEEAQGRSGLLGWDPWRGDGYRRAYAEMLGIWGLEVQRVAVKGLDSRRKEDEVVEVKVPRAGKGKEETVRSEEIELLRDCGACGERIERGRKVCKTCRAKVGGTVCSWCRKAVRGLVMVENCGAVFCRDCEEKSGFCCEDEKAAKGED